MGDYISPTTPYNSKKMSEMNGNNNIVDDFKSLIEIAIVSNSLSDLDDIKSEYRKYSESIQLELEQYEQQLLSISSKLRPKSKSDSRLEKFIRKQKDCLDLWNRNIPFGKWLAEYYIPRYHTLKKPEIQSRVAACLMLLNSSLYIRDTNGNSLTPLPNVMCLGEPGSGKSTFAYQLLKFHDPSRIVRNRNSTNIALIEAISNLNEKQSSIEQPAPILLLDNLDRAVQDDFTTYKDLLIGTRPDECVRAISKRTTNLEGNPIFNYYCYTVGTTVFDIRPLSQSNQFYSQIVSRSFYLMFEQSGLYNDLSEYSWNSLRNIYREFWDDDNNLDRYNRAFDEMQGNYKNYGFPSIRSFDISKMAMATGIAWGVYDDILEAINDFSDYWNALDYLVDAIKDPNIELIRTYVQIIHRRRLEERQNMLKLQKEKFGWDTENEIIPDEINKKDIDTYLIQKCGVRISPHQWRHDIPTLMQSLGYRHDTKQEGYVFVRRF